VIDRFGAIKPHPLLPAERDSRAQWLQALKILNLKLRFRNQALGDRPPGWNLTMKTNRKARTLKGNISAALRKYFETGEIDHELEGAYETFV